MSRTALTVVTALALAALSVGLMLGRRHVLGKEIDGTPGSGTWKVTIEVEGELLAAKDAAITTVLPPDFRHQHIVDESFASRELSHEIRTAKDGGQRKAVWLPHMGTKRPHPFRVGYSFSAAASSMPLRPRVVRAGGGRPTRSGSRCCGHRR
jgi:hypothetical protein